VFGRHHLTTGGPTIVDSLNAAQRDSLKAFLLSIDGRTEPFASDTDTFRDQIAGGP